MHSAFETDDPQHLTVMDKVNMDICELHNCTMVELMLSDDVMDNFEYQCWLQRWHESRFGSRWDHYMIGQVIGSIQNIMSGKSWKPERYMVRSDLSKYMTEPEEITEEQTQAMTFNILAAFAGNEYAAKWKGAPPNASN